MMAGFLALLVYRAKLLALLTLIALLAGEKLAALLRVNLLAGKWHHAASLLGRKLNRPSRSIATRVYRGIVTLLILEIPALATAIILQRQGMELIGAVVIVTLLGRGFASHTLYTRWKQAKGGTLPLEQDDALFNDTHGALRHIITRSAEHFAIRVIGSGFWFLTGGLPAMFAYLALATAANHYAAVREENLAFGWAASRLYRVANAPPRLVAGILLILAGLVVPHANPLRALWNTVRSMGNWLTLIAQLMDVALGGKVVSEVGEYELPWQGEGTAQLTAAHLTRFIALMTSATLLWLMALLTLTIV